MEKVKKLTQGERVLRTLLEAQGGWVSTKYFKQTMLISEVNGRMSELKNKGWDIETKDEKDQYGFAFHRILPKKEMTDEEKYDLYS